MSPYNTVRLFGLNAIDLPVGDTADYDDSYICKGIDGLGPPENDVSISRGKFQASAPRERQLVVRVGLNALWSGVGVTAATLRQSLYGLLTGGYTGNGVSVILMQDATEVARVDGARVSKFEINPFSKDPEVLITLDCLGAYWSAPADYHVPSLGTLSKTNPSFNNTGDAPTGLHMKITFTGTVDTWQIQTQGGLKKLAVRYAPDVSARFLSGDILEFDTTPGQRFIQVTRGVDLINLLGTVTTDSEWFQLYGGTNNFVVNTSAFNWTDIWFRPQFWGV